MTCFWKLHFYFIVPECQWWLFKLERLCARVRYWESHVDPVTWFLFLVPSNTYAQVVLEPLQWDWFSQFTVDSTQQQAANNTLCLLKHIAALGLKVNLQKSCLVPHQSVWFKINKGLLSQWTEGRSKVPSFQKHFIEFPRLNCLLTADLAVIHLLLLHLQPFQCWLIPWSISGRDCQRDRYWWKLTVPH